MTKITDVYEGPYFATLRGEDVELRVIYAETAAGEIFVLDRSDTLSDAGRSALVAKIADRGQIDLAHWDFVRARYGSEAFLEEEAEASFYAQSLSAGIGTLDDVPEALRTLL